MNKLQIKKVGVLSYAKITAVLCFIIGLLLGVIYFFVAVVFGAMLMGVGGRGGAAAGGFSFVYGLIMLIMFPIIYGAVGFISGALGALIYNLLAGMIGGIEIEVENVY